MDFQQRADELERKRRKQTLLGGLIDPGELQLDSEAPPPALGGVAAPDSPLQLGGSPKPPSMSSRIQAMRDEMNQAQGFGWNPASPEGRKELATQGASIYKLAHEDHALKDQNIQSQIDARTANTARRAAMAPGEADALKVKISKWQAQVDAMKVSEPKKAQALQVLIDQRKQKLHEATAGEADRLDTLGSKADLAATTADNAPDKQDAQIDALFEGSRSKSAGTELTHQRTEKLKREAQITLATLQEKYDQLKTIPAQREFAMQMQQAMFNLRQYQAGTEEHARAVAEAKTLVELAKKNTPNQVGVWDRMVGGQPKTGDARAAEIAAQAGSMSPPPSISGVIAPAVPKLAGASPVKLPAAAPLGSVGKKSEVPKINMDAGAESPAMGPAMGMPDKIKPGSAQAKLWSMANSPTSKDSAKARAYLQSKGLWPTP